jgi:hypothetical protein
MRLTAALLLASTVALSAQQPQIQNGQVEARHVTSLDRDIAAIAASATEPAWVGWREVASPGIGNSCCWYQWDSEPSQRGCPVEPAAKDANGNTIPTRPQFPAPSGPARLEAGTEVLVMVRLVDKQVERVRTFSDDCPLDAGNRKVFWLDGVAAADSVKYLQSLITLGEKSGLPTDQRPTQQLRHQCHQHASRCEHRPAHRLSPADPGQLGAQHGLQLAGAVQGRQGDRVHRQHLEEIEPVRAKGTGQR